jgi:hypothetical protein
MGPPLAGLKDNEVYVILGVDASKNSQAIDTSKMNPQQLENCLKSDADAVFMEIMVFYNHKAVCYSNWYLDRSKYSGFTGSNAQVENFTINNNKYATEYPAGWGLTQCFEYLRGDDNKKGETK